MPDIYRRFVNSTAYGTQQSNWFRGSACVFANEEYERNHLIFPWRITHTAKDRETANDIETESIKERPPGTIPTGIPPVPGVHRMNVAMTDVMNMPGRRVMQQASFFPSRNSHTVPAIKVVAASI